MYTSEEGGKILHGEAELTIRGSGKKILIMEKCRVKEDKDGRTWMK
jgi:hypothetical protein